MDFIEGICPHCGKALQIPSDLSEFSCMYCGARMSIETLRTPRAEADPEDYEQFLTQGLSAAVDWPESMGKVTKTEFFDYFDVYYNKCKEPFLALERWVSSRSDDRSAVLDRAAQELTERIEQWFPTQKGWKLRARRTELIERTKFTIAIFLVPTVRRCAPSIGDVFCEKLRKQWLSRHPDSIFELATYDELANGFKKRALCFITTAVCEFLGQPDDCQMLTAFRQFRDGYLRNCPEGPALIDQYYDIAPGIVSRIDYCEDRASVYPALYQTYLVPCYEALCRNDPEACRATYQRMVEHLRKQ